MKKSLDELVLLNLLAEKQLAIASDNKERLLVLNSAIDEHQKMMIESAIKNKLVLTDR